MMRIRSKSATIAATATAAVLAVSGCSANKPGAGAGTDGAVLTVMSSTGPSFQKTFNPFSPTVNPGAKGLLYEPLFLESPAREKGTPWLATKMAWNSDGTQLAFTIRPDVKWSDGTPFTAKDVAFSFNLLVKFPAINTDAFPVASATADGDIATVKFSTVAFAYEQALGNFTPVPEHLWADQDASKWTNPDPIGTGPYTEGGFSAQLITYAKNNSYWQSDTVKVAKIQFPVATPETFVSNLGSGKYDWAGGFVANIQKVFVDKNPEHNKFWFPGDGLVNLVMNVQKAPFNDLKLRSAISMAIDRNELSKTAEQGYEPVPSPTALVLPALSRYMDPQYKDAKFTYDTAKANSLLDSAGYPKGADGIRVAPGGQKLAFTLDIPSGYTDWVTMSTLLKAQLLKIGIEVKPQGVAAAAWSTQLHAGTFQLTIASVAVGTGAYSLYRSFLSKELSAPQGQPAKKNYARWEDPATEKFLKDYASTDDKTAQMKAIHGLEGVVVNQLPVIPLLQSANWFEYRTSNFTGWPDAENPYALPAPYQYPDNLLVITHLTPTKQ